MCLSQSLSSFECQCIILSGMHPSENSSQPPSSDAYKKKVAKTFGQKGKKRGPKYNHVGTTRNGFAWIDEKIELAVEQCPKCGASVEKQKETIIKKNPIAELGSSN